MEEKVAIVAADIKQAFPNVVKSIMANRIRNLGLTENVTKWVENFMSER
jgi:hypothetical protein